MRTASLVRMALRRGDGGCEYVQRWFFLGAWGQLQSPQRKEWLMEHVRKKAINATLLAMKDRTMKWSLHRVERIINQVWCSHEDATVVPFPYSNQEPIQNPE